SRAPQQQVDMFVLELDDLGNQKDLALNAGFLERCLQLLVDYALVCSMLVDDDEAVVSLRHDITIVQLGAGGTEGIIDAIARNLRSLDVRCGWSCIEGCLFRLGQTRGGCRSCSLQA